MEKDFLDWLNQEIVLEPCVGVNGAGEPVFGSPVSYPCRVEERVKNVYSKEGVLVTSTAQIIVDGTVPVGQRDRITLPDGRQPPILFVEVLPDENGQPYYKEIDT